MKCKLLYITIALLLLIFNSTSIYANEIELKASIDKAIVELGGRFRFTISVYGALNIGQPQLPPLDDFSLLYKRPSVSTQTSIVNGKVSVYSSFSYGLIPNKIGKFELGPVELEYKGKTYQSNIVRLEVVDRKPYVRRKGSGEKFDISKRIFVELLTDKKEAYLYEQIVRSFKLYFQKGLPIDDLEYDPAPTKSFLAEKLGEELRYEEVRDGILYNVIELRTALFPVVAGKILIPPAKFKCNVIIRQQTKRGWDPFGNSLFGEFMGRSERRYPIERYTDIMKLKIKPLPETDKPKNFSGAVGSFTMDVLAKPTNVKVGDPITLTINIHGKGNMQTISEPSLVFEGPDDFEVYPAEANTTITDRGEVIKGEKLFSIVIEPQHENIKATPAVSFSYFDPKLEKYLTFTSVPVSIVVEKSDIEIPIQFTLKNVEDGKGLVRILTMDILPIMSDIYSIKNQKFILQKSPIFVAFIFFTPILIVIACLYFQRHRTLLQVDVSYARKRRAPALVRKQLDGTRAIMQSADADSPEFYSSLSRTLTEYIANKINTTPASITHANVSGILESRGVPLDTVEMLRQCLESCDHGRFSSDLHSKEQMESMLNNAEEIIGNLEKQL